MNNPEDIYRHFIQFEEQAAAIYLAMAARFKAENPELGALWLELGMQEKQHANLLQFCELESLFVEQAPTAIQIRNLDDAFAGLAKRAADPGLSIADAFQIATEMETSEVNAIFDHLTSPMHNSMYLARRKILISMPHHVGRLLEEARKHGVAESTLTGLARLEAKTSGSESTA